MFVFIFLAFTLRFICAWIGILILGVLKNYTQISVHICKSSVMLVDHMIHICHPFENKFVLCVWLQDTVSLPTVPGYSAQTQTISRFNSFFFLAWWGNKFHTVCCCAWNAATTSHIYSVTIKNCTVMFISEFWLWLDFITFLAKLLDFSHLA